MQRIFDNGNPERLLAGLDGCGLRTNRSCKFVIGGNNNCSGRLYAFPDGMYVCRKCKHEYSHMEVRG